MKTLDIFLVGLLSAATTLILVGVLCIVSGKSFSEAMGFPFTGMVFALMVLAAWFAVIVYSK